MSEIPGQLTIEEAIEEVERENGVQTALSPSGLEIRYTPRPRRFYEVREENIPWVEVPSVTQCLAVLDSPALSWWGMTIGVEGCLALHGVGLDGDYYDLGLMNADEVVDALKKHKLTVNHQRDKAGERGTSVHDAFEQWARFGLLPNPNDYPLEEFDYVAGLRRLLEMVPFEPEAVEVMVGSIEYHYAGRYDLRASLAKETEVQVNSRRKVKLPAGSYLIDLKTSKGVYPKHALQLAAYEGASVECGYEPTDYRLVIQIGPTGKFDLRLCKTTFEDFLAVRECYEAVERTKSGLRLR